LEKLYLSLKGSIYDEPIAMERKIPMSFIKKLPDSNADFVHTMGEWDCWLGFREYRRKEVTIIKKILIVISDNGLGSKNSCISEVKRW